MACSQYQRWREQLERVYDEQLRDLIINHHIFRQLAAAWTRHAGTRVGADLSGWMVQTFLAFAGTAIRKVAEPPPNTPRGKQRTLSLVILLSDLAANNRLLSRAWFTSRYSKRLIDAGFADRDFNRLAGVRANFVPRRVIRADITAIRRAAAPMKRMVDKVIAHTEHDRRRKGRQTWSHINKAVDLFAAVYRKYYLLLLASSFDPKEVSNAYDVSNDVRKLWP